MSTIYSHQTVRLAAGKHGAPESGVCVMELASMLAGERFGDHPRSVCRLVGALLRRCNDRFDDETRQRLYPYASEAVGSVGDPELIQQRMELCVAAVERHTSLDSWFKRAWRRRLEVPGAVRERDLERFTGRVVAALMRNSSGPDDLLALVDEVLAVRPSAPATPYRGHTARVPAPLR